MNIPEGWPTGRMHLAFEAATGVDISPRVFAEGVKAMLSAAPTPPEVESDRKILQVIAERDQYHEWADKLADAIAVRLGVDIGEHSNINSPWENSLAFIEATPPEVEPIDKLVVRYKVINMAWDVFNNQLHPIAMADKVYALYLCAYPPAPKAEYSATGEPLNLRAAAEDAVKAIYVLCADEDGVCDTLRKELWAARTYLRKFLGGGNGD